MLFLFFKTSKKKEVKTWKEEQRFWIKKIYEKCLFLVRFLTFVKQARIFLNHFGQRFLMTRQGWRFSSFLRVFRFPLCKIFSIFFKKHAEENHLMHETSLIVAVIVVLKSKFFDFKTRITERWNNDMTTIRTIWRYLLMFTITIGNDYPLYGLC